MRGMEERTWDWKPLTACVCPILLFCLVMLVAFPAVCMPAGSPTVRDDPAARYVITDGAGLACGEGDAYDGRDGIRLRHDRVAR